MNKKVIFLTLGVLVAGILNGQTFKDIYQKSVVDNQKIGYPYLREGDVIWSKRVYRLIDLREKANQALYYPIKAVADGRKNFASVLLDEIKKGKLNAYDGNSEAADSAVVPTTYSDIEAKMGAGMQTIKIQDINTQQLKDTTVAGKPNPDNIKQLMLYEEWYFDKKLATLSVRIIGVCPIYIGLDAETKRIKRDRLFWIRYDDIRDVLAKKEAFNPQNDAQRLSFDDLFMQRRFSSYIIAESNVYNDRFIVDYTVGKDAMFEAERVKKAIFDFEHDLWEY